jgi:hypothetical protein
VSILIIECAKLCVWYSTLHAICSIQQYFSLALYFQTASLLRCLRTRTAAFSQGTHHTR